MVDPVGRNIGPYEILEQIGAGGMATVYKAYQPAMSRYVAIKVLPQSLARDPSFRARFQREVRAIARLEHRYILPVYDVGEDQGSPYLVMRYADGGTLSDLLAQRSLSITRMLEIVSQVAEALACAHGEGVIHRDIKPANVLIGRDGSALLSDFGIAKVYAETLQLTDESMWIGTPAYMAPEQIQGQRVDGRTDIYALGAVLYQALTGECPFEADTPLTMALMHLHNQPRPPRQLNPAISEALERVVLRALAKNPDDRFQDAHELVEALRHAQSDLRAQPVDVSTPTDRLPQPADPAPPPTPVPSPGPSRRLFWAMLAVSALIVVLAVFLIPLWNGQVRIESQRDRGPLSQPQAVSARSGGASAPASEQVLWTFNGTWFTNGAHLRSATAGLADRSAVLTPTEALDARGAPDLFLPFTDQERAHNESGTQEPYELRVSSLVEVGGETLVFYDKVQVGPGFLDLKSIGTGVARVAEGSTRAVRAPGLLFDNGEPDFQDAAVVYDGEVYVYACHQDGPLSTVCLVARAPLARVEERPAYQFWDGKQWTPDIGRSQPVLYSPVGNFSVSWNPYLSRFIAVYSPFFSNDVVVCTANYPEGPWSQAVVMFTGMPLPANSDTLVRNSDGREHPELATNGGRTVVVSYTHPTGPLKSEIRLVEVTFR